MEDTQQEVLHWQDFECWDNPILGTLRFALSSLQHSNAQRKLTNISTKTSQITNLLIETH